MFKEAAEDFERAKELDPLNQLLVVNYKNLKDVNFVEAYEPGEDKNYAQFAN
jgi:hypothetical protein